MIVDDVLEESDETLTFAISAGANVTVQSPSNVTFTIAADDSDWNLPFVETFESLTNGPLAGQRGWLGTNAVVQDAVAQNGSKAGSVTSATGQAVHTFSDGQTAVWTDLYLLPTFGRAGDTPTSPTNATFAFFVNLSGNVVVYDSTTQVTTDAIVEEGAWTRFTVYSDYTADTWDLYVEGARVTNGLGFYNTDTASYGKFGVLGAGANDLLDDISIGLESPLPTRGSLFKFR